MDRRRTKRTAANSRFLLQGALSSWVRIHGEWQNVFDRSRHAKNFKRMKLAETKLGECSAQITRLEALLEYRKLVR